MLEDQKAQFPNTEIIAYPMEYAGKTAQEKINEICVELKKNQINSAVIALPESLCWLLNVRASDVPHTPYVLSYGIIHQSGIMDWFVGKERITDIIKSHLPDNVQIYNRQDFYPALANLHGTVQMTLIIIVQKFIKL